MKSQAQGVGRPGRPRSEEKRDAVLEAAAKGFLEHGFRETSMDMVAEAAGVSKQTVYAHFGNKETLYRAVIAAKCRQYRLSDEELPDAAHPVDALTTIGEHYLALLCDPAVVAMYRVVMSESLNFPQIAVMFHEAGPRQGHAALVAFLRRHAALGHFDVDDLDQAVTDFLALLRSDYQYLLLLGLGSPPEAEERRRHAERVARSFMALYASPQSPVV